MCHIKYFSNVSEKDDISKSNIGNKKNKREEIKDKRVHR